MTTYTSRKAYERDMTYIAQKAWNALSFEEALRYMDGGHFIWTTRTTLTPDACICEDL